MSFIKGNVDPEDIASGADKHHKTLLSLPNEDLFHEYRKETLPVPPPNCRYRRRPDMLQLRQQIIEYLHLEETYCSLSPLDTYKIMEDLAKNIIEEIHESIKSGLNGCVLNFGTMGDLNNFKQPGYSAPHNENHRTHKNESKENVATNPDPFSDENIKRALVEYFKQFKEEEYSKRLWFPPCRIIIDYAHKAEDPYRFAQYIDHLFGAKNPIGIPIDANDLSNKVAVGCLNRPLEEWEENKAFCKSTTYNRYKKLAEDFRDMLLYKK